MKKNILFLIFISCISFVHSQGYELKFNRVIDTAMSFSIPCNVNLRNGYFIDILPMNNNSNIITKINSIYIDWPQITIPTANASCGSGGSGQFRLQPALKKNSIYTEITSGENAAGGTKFNGVYWASKGTNIAVKASVNSESYLYLQSAFNGKIRISAIEFLILP